MITANAKDKRKPFQASWWDDFLSRTDNCTQTAVFKNCLSPEETAWMRKQLLHIVSVLSRMRTDEFGYRVYLDGKRLGYKEMPQIYDRSPHAEETVADWASRCFGDKKFGMIINRAEKFNPDLSAWVSDKIAPLLEQKGMPYLGMNFTVFIGNYGWTPLGIHRDERGENVIHFHLGKGGKTMYTWDTAVYEDMTQPLERMNNTHIESYLACADEHTFGEGDLYFMPQGVYHVGRSDELSMGLTLWFHNAVKGRLAKRPLKVILDQYFEESDEILETDPCGVGDQRSFESSLELFKLPEEFENLSFKQLLRESYREFRYALYSNGGFWTRPFPREKGFDFKPQTRIQCASPYKIYYHDNLNGKKIHLYARGTKIVLDRHACIKSLIDRINSGAITSVKDALSSLDPDWDKSIGLYILNLLYVNHGIAVVEK